MHTDRSVTDALLAAGWKLRPTGLPVPVASALPSRYQTVPGELISFLDAAQGAMSPDDTVWFLTASDYEGTSNLAFRWNEWELLSLDGAGTDLTWRAEIGTFWASRLPFLLSVRGEYAYLAIDLPDGSVVFGCEPEFEEVSVVAPSFHSFLGFVYEALRGGAVDPELQRLFAGQGQGA